MWRNWAILGILAGSAALADEMSGMFTYKDGEEPMFLDCATHVTLPVANEASFGALEEHYRKGQKEPGFPLYVTIDARVIALPSEDAGGRTASLVVERYISADPEKMCETPTPQLLSGTWKLVELGGVPISGPNFPFIAFAEGSKDITGSAGCNRFRGPFEAAGSALRFGSMAMTRLACLETEANDLEMAFVKALDLVATYKDDEGALVLLDKEERPLARFTR